MFIFGESKLLWGKVLLDTSIETQKMHRNSRPSTRILALDAALLLIDVYPSFSPWKAPMMHRNVPVNSFLSLSYHNKNRGRANQTLTGTSWRQNMEACPSQLWNYDFSSAVKVVQRPCYMDLAQHQQFLTCFSIYLNTLHRNTKICTDLTNYDRIDNLFSEFKNIDFQLHNKRNAAE